MKLGFFPFFVLIPLRRIDAMHTLKLGTRGSPLALWQAHETQRLLGPFATPQRIELVHIETEGDRDQATLLSAMGGYGVFTKAIQNALLAERVDVAVHSLKDLPTIPTEGLLLAAVLPRAPRQDAWVSQRWPRFADLPHGARVGTSSLRRRAQLLNHRPDLQLVDLRGNVDTRLRKLVEQDLDGIILAAAGLVRLGLDKHIREFMDESWMLPAVGQGAIGLECRVADTRTRELLACIQDHPTWAAVQAERAMLAALGGGCLVPIGTTSHVQDGLLHLRGAVLSADGQRRIVASHAGLATAPLTVGQELAAMLLQEGAAAILPAV